MINFITKLIRATGIFPSQKKEKLYGISDTVYLSFGENCLPQNIINRYRLKSFTTPFAHGRSNIEYILKLEEENYADLLNTDFLKYEILHGKKTARLVKYKHTVNAYAKLHMNGFEFTHHDVIASEKTRNKILDRVTHLQKNPANNKYIILYHHKVCNETNNEILMDDLCRLKEMYSLRQPTEIVLFKQVIINDRSSRRIDFGIDKGIHVFNFYTQKIWDGDNPLLLWAIKDEDLIKQMIKKIKKI